MRALSLIGLLILAIGLVVVSSPAALAVSASWVEKGGYAIGIGEPEDPWADVPEDVRVDEGEDGEAAAEAETTVRGFQWLEEEIDIMDTFEDDDRVLPVHRLASGRERAYLPGEPRRGDVLDPPLNQAEDGLILDAIGCPVIDVDAGLEAYLEELADEPLQDRVDAAINGLEQPAQDECLLRRNEATLLLLDPGADTSAERRRQGSAQRGGAVGEAMWVNVELRMAQALGMLQVAPAVAESAALVGVEVEGAGGDDPAAAALADGAAAGG